MKATDGYIIDFLNDRAQYYVPIYQRKYSWELSHCDKLFHDIEKVALDETRQCHFLGSVIYLPDSSAQHNSGTKKYFVIDGQQRLMTISLLLLALCDYTEQLKKAGGDIQKLASTSWEQLQDFLISRILTGDIKYKIRLNQEDFATYKALFDSRTPAPEFKKTRIFENYSFFMRKLNEEKIDPQIIFHGIQKLKFIDMNIEVSDNAQLIFETVNTTGKSLSSVDKIRNFILMAESPDGQERIYNNYWHPMEVALRVTQPSCSCFDDFFWHYMHIILQRQISGDVYLLFQDYYFEHRHKGTTAIVEHIKKYSQYFLRWEKANEHSWGIDHAIYKIKITGKGTIVPFVMQLLAKLEDCAFSEQEAINVLYIIESYWMRRSLCGLPTNTAGSVSVSLLKCLNLDGNMTNNIIKTIRNFTWSQRMPDDEEMLKKLREAKLYNSGRIGGEDKCRMILDLIEQHENKDYVHDSKYSIEHIMPQTINNPAKNENEDWIADLGDDCKRIQDKYCDTLGNLTLTSFNSEYHNYRFLKKRDMENGYANTPIRISSMLAKFDRWDEKAIIARADYLTKIIIDIWKYPIES